MFLFYFICLRSVTYNNMKRLVVVKLSFYIRDGVIFLDLFLDLFAFLMIQ